VFECFAVVFAGGIQRNVHDLEHGREVMLELGEGDVTITVDVVQRKCSTRLLVHGTTSKCADTTAQLHKIDLAVTVYVHGFEKFSQRDVKFVQIITSYETVT